MATQQFVSPRDMLDIVFANRNQSYGAYQLRRAYPRHLGRALGMGMLLILCALVIPEILNAVSNAFPEPPPVNTVMVMGPPPDISAEVPPPPTLPPTPPPERAVQRFAPPAVTPDEQVPDEHPPAIADLINTDADIGVKDQASTGEAPPSLNDVPDLPVIVETQAKEDDGEYSIIGVQKPPAFPGGEQALLQYLAEHIKYPPLARENNIQGTIALSFVVGKDGRINNAEVVKEIGGGCGKEALRVLQSMPNWIPGEANGHAVKVRFTLPVRFRLQ